MEQLRQQINQWKSLNSILGTEKEGKIINSEEKEGADKIWWIN